MKDRIDNIDISAYQRDDATRYSWYVYGDHTTDYTTLGAGTADTVLDVLEQVTEKVKQLLSE